MNAFRRPAEPYTRSDPRNHYCEGPNCRAWGSHGFSDATKRLRWFCGSHKALGSCPVRQGEGA